MTCNPLAILFYIQTENCLPALNWYKNRFDDAILTNNYDNLESATITLECRVIFCGSTCFCPMFDILGNPIVYGEFDLPMPYISVIPDENQTNLIFSWFIEDHCVYGFLDEQLKIAPTRLILKYLNNLLPLNCENMTIGPSLWNDWSDTAKEDFVNVAYNHINNEVQKDISKTYYEEKAYNLFMEL